MFIIWKRNIFGSTFAHMTGSHMIFFIPTVNVNMFLKFDHLFLKHCIFQSKKENFYNNQKGLYEKYNNNKLQIYERQEGAMYVFPDKIHILLSSEG